MRHKQGPCFLCGIGVFNQRQIFRRNHAMVRQRLQIDDIRPIGFVEKNDGNARHLSGLHNGQQFEQLIQRAEAAGKYDKRPCAHGQMHLAHVEIMKLECQLRRCVGIGNLFMRERDVEADAGSPRFKSAPVGRLHDARPAARGDHMGAGTARSIQRAATLRTDAAKCSGLFIPTGEFAVLVRSRAAKNDHSRNNIPASQNFLGLGIFQQEADAAHGIAKEKIPVQRRQPVRGRGLLQNGLWRFRIMSSGHDRLVAVLRTG